jgi:hypothetical protein
MTFADDQSPGAPSAGMAGATGPAAWSSQSPADVMQIRSFVRTIWTRAERSQRRVVRSGSFWSFANSALTIPAAIAAALSGLSALNKRSILAAVLAAVAAVLTGLNGTLTPAAKAADYVTAARALYSFRHRVEQFLYLTLPEDRPGGIDLAAAEAQARSYSDELDKLIQQAPYLARWTEWRLASREAPSLDERERNAAPPASAGAI